MPAFRDFPDNDAPPFESRNAEVIRSIQQRDLLNKWLLLYAPQNRPPASVDYDPALAEKDRSMLVQYHVSDVSGRTSFLITSYGSHISEAYGRTGLGQELSHYLGEKRAPSIVPLYEECVRRQLPVYTIARMTDRSGREVDMERLLLPFSDGSRITNIMGSFETISKDGHFQLQQLMAEQQPIELLRAVIDRDLHFTPPPRIPSHDKIEFE